MHPGNRTPTRKINKYRKSLKFIMEGGCNK
jgi:hypothetical protein